MHKVASILTKLITLIMLGVSGVWIAGVMMGQWYRLEASGAFVKWKRLDAPQKFQEIVNVEDFQLRARASNGTIYAYTTEWKEWQPDPNDVTISGYGISTDCESVYGFISLQSRYPPPEAGAPLECGVSESRHPLAGSVDTAYYVLVENGTIWMWRHTRDPQQEFFIFAGGLFTGLMIGIITWFLIQKRI